MTVKKARGLKANAAELLLEKWLRSEGWEVDRAARAGFVRLPNGKAFCKSHEWVSRLTTAMRRRKHGAQVTSGHRRAAAIAIDDAVRFLEAGCPDLALDVLRQCRERAYTPQESKRFAALEADRRLFAGALLERGACTQACAYRPECICGWVELEKKARAALIHLSASQKDGRDNG